MPTYITKNMAAASSTGVGTFSSGGVVVLSCTDLITGRRVIVWGSSALGASIAITGLSETLGPIGETVASSTTVGAAVQTIQDYRKVTGVTVSCGVASTAAYLGTSSQGGTPWFVVDTTRNPISVSFAVEITSPTTVVVASVEYSNDYPSYDPVSRTWVGSSPTTGPRPTISSMGSSLTADAVGRIDFPIAAWRVTMTSTSSGAGSIAASVFQAGV